MTATTFLSALAMTLALPVVRLAANSIVPVPEPATGLLIIAGFARAAMYRKLRGSRQ